MRSGAWRGRERAVRKFARSWGAHFLQQRLAAGLARAQTGTPE